MAELKTKATTLSATDFLKTIEPRQKRDDGFALLEMFESTTGEKAVMWGASLVGFGKYHYKSERSAQEGDWAMVGFSPRKQNLTLYLLNGLPEKEELLKNLGKYKVGVGCVYINKLSDVDSTALKTLIKKSYEHMKKNFLN